LTNLLQVVILASNYRRRRHAMGTIRKTGSKPTAVFAEKEKEKMLGIRLPPAIRERFEKQVERLQCSRNMLVRMAVIQFLEELEEVDRKRGSAGRN